MLFNILLGALTLWTAVYSFSYALFLFKNKQLLGGALLTALPLAVTVLYANFILQFF